MGNHKILKAPGAGSVRYSMYDFIEYVHQHPVIWSHNHENFHNREQREDAWHIIAQRLYNSFNDLPNDEKKKILETLTKRWKNTRDSFLRAHRLKKVDEEAHSYIYGREMQFLVADNEYDGDGDGTKNATFDNSNNDSIENAPKAKGGKRIKTPAKRNTKTARKKRTMNATTIASPAPPPPPIKKRRTTDNSNLHTEIEELCRDANEELHHYSEEDNFRIIELETNNQGLPNNNGTELKNSMLSGNSGISKEEQTNSDTIGAFNEYNNSNDIIQPNLTNGNNKSDPDQAFFDSIKPVIRKMTLDQKLDFQIEILKLLKKFHTN